MAPAFADLGNSIVKQTVTVAFSRRPGGADIQIPIDISVENTDRDGRKVRSPKAGMEFLDCAEELVNSKMKK